ncbi:MAG: esterase [bacterium ADurb.Bin429]|nr:MAG: esterase [bacterium ADurb.Bin429]
MTSLAYTDSELTLELPFGTRHVLLRMPERMAARPCLLINLAGSRQWAMHEMPYALIPAIFTAAGHPVASFDLPYHGELATDERKELRGIAAAMAAGEDPLAEVRAVGRALIDAALAQGLADAGRIVIAGTSRGGFSALHVMAADTRVHAAAALVPVTDLAALTETQALAAAVIARDSATALIPALANRHVFLATGERDDRVSADACFAFYGKLLAAAREVRPVLRVFSGVTHTGSFPYEPLYLSGAAYLLERCAEAVR